MKRKLLEFGGAAVVLLGILGILYLVLGRIGNGPPEVGSVTIRCGEESVIPLGNEIYRTEDGKKREERRLVPEEIGEEAPLLAYNDDITAKYEGNSENGSFYFTIYTDEFQGYTEKKSWFTPLEAVSYTHLDVYKRQGCAQAQLDCSIHSQSRAGRAS